MSSLNGTPSPSVKRPKPSAFRRWHLYSTLVALGTVIAWAWMANHGAASTHKDEDAQTTNPSEEPAPLVALIRPKPGGIPRTTAQPGSVHAFESVELYAMVSGYLKTQAVDIGSHVTKGQVLAEIGVPREARAAEEATALIDQARAQLLQAKARVKAEEAERNTAAATVAQTKADVERTISRRRLAESQFQRVKSLYERRAVEQRLVDEQRHEVDTAAAAEEVTRLAIQTAEARLETAAAKIDQAKADVAEAAAAERVTQARLAKVQVDLDYSRITAPFDGVVTRRAFHPGAFIRSATDGGETPLLTVVRVDLMRVVVQVPDRDVVYANPGDSAVVSIDALSGEQFRGTIARISESEDPTTRTMRVEIDLPNPNDRLRSGMYGRASIGLESHPERMTIPIGCIVERSGNGQGTVNLVRNGRVHRTKVTLGFDDGTAVEVVSGVAPEDDVVLRTSSPLEDGMPVTSKKAG